MEGSFIGQQPSQGAGAIAVTLAGAAGGSSGSTCSTGPPSGAPAAADPEAQSRPLP